jgi:hypothetical protein
MKRNVLKGVLFGLLTITTRLDTAAQSFLNLDFESTTLPPAGPPSTVATTTGLPGWAALIAGTSQSTILYNNATLGNSSIALLGSGNSVNPVIQGTFSVMLTAGASPGNSSLSADAEISQTGVVPPNTRSLLFEAYSQGNGLGLLSVALNGLTLEIVPITTTASYTIYGGDISTFAGKRANLSFTAVSDYPQGFEIYGLDAISFSASPVPEPSVLGLLAVGLCFLGRRALSTRR